MPLLKIQSSKKIESPQDILKKVTTLLSDLLGKPERYIMVSLENNPDMLFGGTDEPLMYVELKSIGLPQNKTRELSAALSEFLHKETGVTPDRIYIEFSDAERAMWGWNGSTFG
jgi:phenylpyruvate tautomerase PptA (4-oxalocrotonate tautomerase family)